MKNTNDPNEAPAVGAKHNGLAPDASHEANLVDSGGIVRFGISLALLIAVSGILMWASFRYFAAREANAEPPPSRLSKTMEQKLPPEPRLQGLPGHEIEPLKEMKTLRSNDRATLESYGWVDQKAGVVRIPISRAMELVVERGWSVAGDFSRGAAEPQKAGDDQNPRPGNAPAGKEGRGQ